LELDKKNFFLKSRREKTVEELEAEWEKIKMKIEKKILGIGIYRAVSGEKPRMLPSEFRFIIGCYGIKKNEWWNVLKEFESSGVIKISKNKRHINILMNGSAIQKFIIQKKL